MIPVVSNPLNPTVLDDNPRGQHPAVNRACLGPGSRRIMRQTPDAITAIVTYAAATSEIVAWHQIR